MNLLKIKTKKIEKIFHKTIKQKVSCLGVDTASRTGWARITTGKVWCEIDYGFIEVKTPDKYFKYNRYIEAFKSILRPEDIIVIEETYYGRNVKVFQLLSRLGAFVYTLAHLINVPKIYFILATTCRKQLGFPGNLKKPIIHKMFKERLDLDIDDEDVIDAIMLALTGILEEQTLENA